MSGLVLDASVALALLLGEAALGDLDEVAIAIAEGRAVAPDLLPREVLNGLVSAHKRGRVDAEQVYGSIQTWVQMPVRVYPAGDIETQVNVATLSLRHGLSAYDGAYLELAVRLKLPMASFDKRLIEAAKAEGNGVIVDS